MKHVVVFCITSLLILGWRTGRTRAMFADVGQTTGSFAASTDWSKPDSNASVSSAYQSGTTFAVNYTASDNESGLDAVALYYRKGISGAYTLFATDDYNGETSVLGNFSFVASEGDGTYEFYTVARDVYGNDEEVSSNPDTSTISDTLSPVTTLSTSSGVVLDEKITNGNFDDVLNGWIAKGTIWISTSETVDTGTDTLTIAPPSGSGFMIRVGQKEDNFGDVSDGQSIWNNELSQTFNRTNSTLSFYWRAVSFDTSDSPAVVVMANDKEILSVTGSDINSGGYPNDSGWRRAFLDLSTLSDEKVELRFYAGNTDPFNVGQSWVYIANATTGKPIINSSDNILLTALDAGSDVLSIMYSLDNGTNWTTSTGNTAIPASSLIEGSNGLLYYSTDNAGNSEPIPSNPIEVILSTSAPDIPSDFSAIGISEHEVQTSWTAPAGAGYFSQASLYQMRMSTTMLDSGNFDSATTVQNVPAPAVEGESQSFTISGLTSGIQYWIGMKACDPVGNCSDPTIIDSSTIVEHTTDPGDVVISEIQWMGTSVDPKDQWVELRNMTDQAIDLTGWQLTKLTGTGEVLMYTISTSTSILANGYILISQFNETNSALKNSPDLAAASGTTPDVDFEMPATNLEIKLYKADWTDTANLIDTVDDGDGDPAAGLSNLDGNSVFYSMERNALPGNGEDAGNWYTTFADTSAYFDDGSANIKGTPGGEN